MNKRNVSMDYIIVKNQDSVNDILTWPKRGDIIISELFIPNPDKPEPNRVLIYDS